MLSIILLSLIYLVSSQHRLEPSDGSILHCCGQANPDFSGAPAFTGYSDALNVTTRPVIFMVYLPISNDVSNMQPWFNALQNILNSYPAKQWVGVQLGLWFSGLVSQVASGQYDANIAAMITGMKSTGRPYWVRIGYEFNGEWNNYNPANEYQVAFQRITNKFRADSWANKYVATVWDYATDAQNLNYMSFYPGDSYVDWWAVNIFSGPSAPTASLVTSFAQQAKSKGFPVMLGESTPRYTGVTQGQTSWNAWFQPYFYDLIGNPANGIRAFCYINWNWTDSQWPTWGDAEIENNKIVLNDYQIALNKGDFFNANTESKVKSRLGLS